MRGKVRDIYWNFIRLEGWWNKTRYEIFEKDSLKTLLTPAYRLSALNFRDPRIQEGLRLSFLAIENIKTRLDAVQADLLVLFLPTKELVFKDVVLGSATKVSQSFKDLISNEELLWERTKAFLSKKNIPFSDPLSALREEVQKGEQPYGMTSDGHLNPKGHRVVAQLLIREIKDKDLI